MIEHDDELRKLLRQWQPPSPSPELDKRVFGRMRKRRMRLWLPIAAGVLLAVGAGTLWRRQPPSSAEFVPLPNGAITIQKAGGN